MTEGSNKKEGPVYLWRERYTVKSYDVDMRMRMSLTGLLGCFLESAWQHARRCGFGYEALAEKGQFWVLSRLHLEISRPPLWRDAIVIETWSKGTNGLFALRDFQVEDKEKEAVVRATSGWLILDRETKRPRRLDDFEKTMPLMRDKEAVQGPPEKIDSLKNHRACRTDDVRFCDIDLNNHANSTKYIEWIINSFPYETLSRSFPSLLLINFLAEAVYGDRVTLFVETPVHEKHEYVVSLQREKDAKELARARIVWA